MSGCTVGTSPSWRDDVPPASDSVPQQAHPPLPSTHNTLPCRSGHCDNPLSEPVTRHRQATAERGSTTITGRCLRLTSCQGCPATAVTSKGGRRGAYTLTVAAMLHRRQSGSRHRWRAEWGSCHTGPLLRSQAHTLPAGGPPAFGARAAQAPQVGDAEQDMGSHKAHTFIRVPTRSNSLTQASP